MQNKIYGEIFWRRVKWGHQLCSLKKIASKEKEGKLNEVEKSRAEIRAGLKVNVKTGSTESGKKKTCHVMHCFTFAADINVATLGMNGVRRK